VSDPSDSPPDGRLTKTLAYYGTFIGLGLALASLGPTLPGLAELTGSTLGALSTIFVARSAGYLTGAMLGGRLFDRFPGHPLMAGMLALMAASLALVPLSPSVAILTIVLYAVGFGEGALDAGGNTLLVWLYPTGLGPWMNGLHFFFGIGAFISPLVVSYAIGSDGSVSAAYWILAALLIPFIILVGIQPSPAIARHASHPETGLGQHRGTIWLVAGLLFATVGAEVGYGNWIYTYAMTRNLADAGGAAALTSAYWGAFTLGRLAGIPLAARATPTTIMNLCFGGIIAASLAILSHPDTEWLLWAGTIAAGVAVAPMFATVISLAEGRMPISGRATGWFFVGSSTGGMSIPWVIGQLFETHGTDWTFYIVLADVFVGLVVLVIFNRYAPRHLPASAS
jgi:FHS family Na+ dependent glucose MFS transporter 1